MGIATDIAPAIDIVIAGKKCKLHPLRLYEIGVLERKYAASLRWTAVESTKGLGAEERRLALEAAGEQVASLAADVTPLYRWFIGSQEGMINCFHACVDNDDVTMRECGHWISVATAKGESPEAEQFNTWMIASGLRPDPTEDESPSQEAESPPSKSKKKSGS